jgi:hypothetical protein
MPAVCCKQGRRNLPVSYVFPSPVVPNKPISTVKTIGAVAIPLVEALSPEEKIL